MRQLISIRINIFPPIHLLGKKVVLEDTRFLLTTQNRPFK